MRLSHILVVLFPILLLTSCSKEGSVPETRFVGYPPSNAFLGVEYYYVMGAEGGDQLLDFALTNNPEWLSLERPNSLIRPGVVLRGVPGVTGGGRADLDAGKNENLRITVNDGVRSGSLNFSVEVKPNVVNVDSLSVSEGEIGSVTRPEVAEGEQSKYCSLPKMEEKELNIGGQYIKVYPVLIPVNLSHPSVLDTKIKYQLTTKFRDGLPEDQSSNPSAGKANSDYFIDYDDESEVNKPFYDALKPAADDAFKPGEVFFPAGVTTCYVRVYLSDDSKAEANEDVTIKLVSVVSGLVDIGTPGTITIRDNEPVATFSEESVIVQNEGTERSYRVRLSKAPGKTFDRFDADGKALFKDLTFRSYIHVKLAKTTRDEFTPLGSDSEATDLVISPVEGDDLIGYVEFTGDQTEGTFNISLPDDGDNESGPDETFRLFIDNVYGSIGAVSDEQDILVRINEWKSGVNVNEGSERFKKIAVDEVGTLFLVGDKVTGSEAQGFLRVYDRFGNKLEDIEMVRGQSVESIGVSAQRRMNFDDDDNDPSNDYFDELIAGFNVVASEAQMDNSDIEVVKYSKISNEINYQRKWDKTFGSPDLDEAVYMLASSSDVYITGKTIGDWSFEKAPDNQVFFENKGGFDAFVTKIVETENTPKVAWHSIFGTSGNDIGKYLERLGGDILFLGETEGLAGFQSFGGVDGFISKLPPSTGEFLFKRQIGSSQDDTMTLANVTRGLVIAGSSSEEIRIDEEKPSLTPKPRNTFNDRKAQFNVLTASLSVEQTKVVGYTGDTFLTAHSQASRNGFYGGFTMGDFRENDQSAGGKDAILFRMDINSVTDTSEVVWSEQISTQAEDEIVDVFVDSDSKLFYLLKTDNNYRLAIKALDGQDLAR